MTAFQCCNCTASVLLVLGIAAGCTPGSGDGAEGRPPPAAPTVTNMPLPGIGLEAEDGLLFLGTYNQETKNVAVNTAIEDDSIYRSEDAPFTHVPGFDVTGDLGGKIRTLELVTGPWEASYDVQARAVRWMSEFYGAIHQVAGERGSAASIDSATVRNGARVNLRAFNCALLSKVVAEFEARTGLELRKGERSVYEEGEFFVCLSKAPQDFIPQANYGVKLTAFVDGALARDFQGRPGRVFQNAKGKRRAFGPGCGLTDAVRSALRSSTAQSVVPTDAEAFCQPSRRYTTGECRGDWEQPALPCFPTCLMGQLCYGIGTNSIWYDGRMQSADGVLCGDTSGECREAETYNFSANFPLQYATKPSDALVATWKAEEVLALRSFLVINRCATWIGSLSTDGLTDQCFQPFFWEKQAMGVLPKAFYHEFRHHLPAGFSGYYDSSDDPPFTTLSAYTLQVCGIPMILGDAAREKCRDYIDSRGFFGEIGGKEIRLFRIDGDLALVAESRFQTLYVAGGYLGVRQSDGSIDVSAQAMAESINFVRSINGFGDE